MTEDPPGRQLLVAGVALQVLVGWIIGEGLRQVFIKRTVDVEPTSGVEFHDQKGKNGLSQPAGLEDRLPINRLPGVRILDSHVEVISYGTNARGYGVSLCQYDGYPRDLVFLHDPAEDVASLYVASNLPLKSLPRHFRQFS